MKAKVDPELCIGCGLCEQLCAAVFKMEDNVAVAIADSLPDDAGEYCHAAADTCPVEAIAITE